MSADGKGGRGALGRGARKKGCLRADSGRLLAIVACRCLPVQRGETEAVFPMKYSPRLSLKRSTERGMGGCAWDRGRGREEGWREAPNLLDVTFAKASLFYEVGDGGGQQGVH